MSVTFEKVVASTGATIAVIWLAGLIGWIMNIVQIVKTPGSLTAAETWTTMLVVKAIGILAAPVGAVLGWVGLFV